MKDCIDSTDFTVIVCCFNPDILKLKRTLISIKNQININYEIIISDDGSEIEYLQEIKLWLKDIGLKCKFNILHNNTGTVNSILSAINISNGKYIKTISPGDYLFNENSLYDYHVAFQNSGAKLVFSKAAHYSSNKLLVHSCIPKDSQLFNQKEKLEKFIAEYGSNILGATIAYEKTLGESILTRVLGSSRLLEDVPLMLISILDEVKIFPINKYLIWYEYGTGVSTKSLNAQLINDEKGVLKYIEHNYHSKLAKKIVKNRTIMLTKNKYVRYLKMMLQTPMCFIYHLKIRMSKFKLPDNISIDQLNKITNIN